MWLEETVQYHLCIYLIQEEGVYKWHTPFYSLHKHGSFCIKYWYAFSYHFAVSIHRNTIQFHDCIYIVPTSHYIDVGLFLLFSSLMHRSMCLNVCAGADEARDTKMVCSIFYLYRSERSIRNQQFRYIDSRILYSAGTVNC